jgi:hypothetical protein
VDTSIGAVNAAGLAFWGTNQDGITALEQAYQKMQEGHLMDQRLEKLAFAVLQRQACVETELAKAQGVPVHYMQLKSSPPIPIWDFSKHRELIEIGYDIACHEPADQHQFEMDRFATMETGD